MITATNTCNATTDLLGFRRVAAQVNYRWWQKEMLWFDLPETIASTATDAGNAWLMALLPLAFELGQSLKINTPVDAGLLQNAEELQRIWVGWFPKKRPIRIMAEPAANTAEAGNRTGCFFTAGVDSFFSALHFDATGGGQKVNDLIYVWGYDIPLENRSAFDGKMKALARIGSQLEKTIIPVATNLRQTRIGKLDWATVMHGQALGAVGLLMGGRFKTILVSASLSPGDMRACGTHLLTTTQMSSSRLKFLDYGSDFYRYDKVAFIASNTVALENLHVCWVGRNEINRGRCEKCYRTLLSLELLNCRQRATSFPQEGFSLENLQQLKLPTNLAAPLFEEISRAARQINRLDVVVAVDGFLAANRSLNK